jgi:hypothetical protein
MGFTGAMVGLWVQYLTGAGHSAQFRDITYHVADEDR